MLLNRNIVPVDTENSLLQVFHWNILSDQLSGFFPSVEDKYLEWDYRKRLISEELINCKADILCLSEVDHFEDFIQPLLAAHGYHSLFRRKKGWHRDGLCIAYKNDRLRLIQQSSIYLPKSNQFALAVQVTLGTIPILILSTHLKSGSEYEKIRLHQITYLLEQVSKFNSKQIIFCGDFNCTPNSLTYNAIKSHKIGFKSAYFGLSTPETEPEITTYKKREELAEFNTIDYIFFKGFRIASALKLPSLKEVEKIGMPSRDYPSDHLSLMCSLYISLSPSL